jgi:hypothetical protein
VTDEFVVLRILPGVDRIVIPLSIKFAPVPDD